MLDKILEADRKIQDEYIHSKVISEETYNLCEEAMDIPFKLLTILEQYIDDLEKQLFDIKYDKKKLTKEEKEYLNDLEEK